MVVQGQVSGSKPKTPHWDYSTVTDLSLPQDLIHDKGTNSFREILTIKVLFTSSNLWMSPYSKRQTELFELIRTQHEEMGKNFKQISDWLNQHGYKTTRGHTFRQNHVWSMFFKKKKSNERFGREFVPSFRSVTVEIMDTLPPE